MSVISTKAAIGTPSGPGWGTRLTSTQRQSSLGRMQLALVGDGPALLQHALDVRPDALHGVGADHLGHGAAEHRVLVEAEGTGVLPVGEAAAEFLDLVIGDEHRQAVGEQPQLLGLRQRCLLGLAEGGDVVQHADMAGVARRRDRARHGRASSIQRQLASAQRSRSGSMKSPPAASASRSRCRDASSSRSSQRRPFADAAAVGEGGIGMQRDAVGIEQQHHRRQVVQTCRMAKAAAIAAAIAAGTGAAFMPMPAQRRRPPSRCRRAATSRARQRSSQARALSSGLRSR